MRMKMYLGIRDNFTIKINVLTFKYLVLMVSWDEIYSLIDANEIFNDFCTRLSDIVDKAFPLVRIKI